MSESSPSSKTKAIMIVAIIAIVVALVLVVQLANRQALSGELTYENPVMIAQAVNTSLNESIVPRSQDGADSEGGPDDAQPAVAYAVVQTDYDASLVTIDEYSDFECPACKNMAPILKEILQTYPGQVQLRYHDNPLTSIHPFSYQAALAGECAARQDRFVPMHDALFAGQEDWSTRTYETRNGPLDSVFIEYAQSIGAIDMEAFRTCIASQDAKAAVEEDMSDANRQNINSTPTIFVDGERFVGQRYETLREMVATAVEAALGSQTMPMHDAADTDVETSSDAATVEDAASADAQEELSGQDSEQVSDQHSDQVSDQAPDQAAQQESVE